MIDLRSDTVTRPTPGMLQAMMSAEVGDDVIDIDPTVVRLQEFTAAVLGKEAAIFMPSGTMTNQIALRVHCSPGDEFICDSECHIYNYEQGAFAQLSGLVAKTIPGQFGILSVDQLRNSIRPDNEHMVRTKLICLENTHNRGAGSVYPLAVTHSIANWVKENGLLFHLDGARLFNAAIAVGRPIGELAAPFDSISICFSKGLGAPVGSCLAGSKEFIAKARRARKLLGGGMRQVGYLAAAAIFALEHHVDRLAIDHVHAKKLAAACSKTGIFKPIAEPETNIVILQIDSKWGTAAQFIEKLKKDRILALAFGPQSVRFVTHLDNEIDELERACDVIKTLA